MTDHEYYYYQWLHSGLASVSDQAINPPPLPLKLLLFDSTAGGKRKSKPASISLPYMSLTSLPRLPRPALRCKSLPKPLTGKLISEDPLLLAALRLTSPCFSSLLPLLLSLKRLMSNTILLIDPSLCRQRSVSLLLSRFALPSQPSATQLAPLAVYRLL